MRNEGGEWCFPLYSFTHFLIYYHTNLMLLAQYSLAELFHALLLLTNVANVAIEGTMVLLSQVM